MKARILALAPLLLVCAATGKSQAPRPLLAKTVTGVNATSDVAVNVSMDRGFVLSGAISGDPASTPSSIVAVSTTTPFGSFIATISQAINRYRIELPAGTYNLNVSFTKNGTSFFYTDSTLPTPFTVSADTDRNITLPAVITSTVTGMVSNLNASFSIRSLTFDSTTISGFTDVSAGAALDVSGNYSVNLPAGTFTVQLSQSASSFVPPATFSTSGLSTNFGSQMATNPLNFAAPTITTATLSGTVSITGSAMIPTGSFLLGSDISGPPPPTTTSSGSETLPSNGSYSFTLGTGDKYALNVVIPVQLLPSPAPVGTYTPAADAMSSPLTTNSVLNPTFPALPGAAVPFTISGHVTVTGSTAPVPNVNVSAFSTALSVGPNTSFARSTTTNANGDYSIVVAAGTYTLSFQPGPAAGGDFDGDGKADTTVFRPPTGQWFIIPSSNPGTPIVKSWGLPGDVVVPGDYDGDRKTDIAVWRTSTGQWFIIPSSNPGTPIVQSWGLPGDVPAPGDYDGDGKTDFAIWRPSTGQWFIIPSSNPGTPIVQSWGLPGDVPVPGDYDGDGKTDFAVWRPSTGQWFIIPSSNPGTPIVQSWGLNGDVPVPGDYDGDGKTDFAVWRPSSGQWLIIPSGNSTTQITQSFGLDGDIPVPADYDGDQIVDIAVWRPSTGQWYIIPSSSPMSFTVTSWGLSGDVPVQKPIGQ